MPMVTVSVSPEQAARMRHAVECGAYASGSEVVRAALRLWAASVDVSELDADAKNQQNHEDERVNVAELFAAHADRKRCG
ncbi:type II toxin-antitoxin system ParD family antitoxin [Agrobacterium sp.]|uniref:ribbon-helix-helix domain-containing protein n=1 Tax=Agrobacterium sp. TaxID=361 RepID=UPI0028AA4C7F|nr:type II toxin-antitoxin system ParD family antitoxin [Agrobacterium sp.]